MFVHTVQSGDSLFSISRKYGYPVDSIRSVNGLEETNIVPGQALLIPLNEYTVQPNDTYAVIAGKAYVPQMQLMQANPDIPPNRLRTGMKVKVLISLTILREPCNFMSFGRLKRIESSLMILRPIHRRFLCLNIISTERRYHE